MASDPNCITNEWQKHTEGNRKEKTNLSYFVKY